MTNKLEMSLEQFAEAVAKENERLISGPGGIMEMKQTIADKEAEIADKERRLENVHKAYEKLGHMYNNLIAKNEYAKNEKVLLDWTENYGQGSEPWLNKE